MIAIYLHPPKTQTSGEDYLLEALDVVRWWKREKIVGNACLVPVEHQPPQVICSQEFPISLAVGIHECATIGFGMKKVVKNLMQLA